ncbi:MAG: hypothetical protein HW402_1423 [Dehalococcoidales bacterium]|nr:hypothetical protein [Dehalococcoidales bacterium]
MKKDVTEKEVSQIWQYQWLNRKGLVTEDNEPIEIIYPGRINDNQGADFCDAVIARRMGIMKGDIEIHRKSSDWRTHRHHHDASYNRVILHVVMQHNTRIATSLQNGTEIPVLALEKYLKTPQHQPGGTVYPLANLKMPCRKVVAHLGKAALGGCLDEAGEERFLAKSGRFQAELAQMEASQCLYRGIMGALGYSRNKPQFLELAGRLPLRVLESIMDSGISGEGSLLRQQALLLGMAGLLSSPCQEIVEEQTGNGQWLDRLSRCWASYQRTDTMSPDDWHLFKVRPNNSPIRRLLAMSYLTNRFRPGGLLPGLIDLVREAPAGNGGSMERALLVRTGYAGSGPISTLLGRGRAADIIVNVLLPFALAWGELAARPELGRKAMALYDGYSRLSINSVEKHMEAQLGLGHCLINSARRQQGLIHIYYRLCTQGRCQDCGLS